MRIAVLGWGSLIWAPDNLETASDWMEGGPTLPVEFSRVSGDARLTLVIDSENGVPNPMRWCISAHRGLEIALANLQEREGTVPHRIGFVEKGSGRARCKVFPEAETEIMEWAESHRCDAVIWTDLPSNFEDRTGASFTVERAISYLSRLAGDELARAREYVIKAPSSIVTPLRTKLAARGWTLETMN